MRRRKKSPDIIRHRLSCGLDAVVRRITIRGLFNATLSGKKIIRAEILVDPRLKKRQEMTSYVHELLHAELPSAPEAVVDTIARSVSRLLWHVGYRRIK